MPQRYSVAGRNAATGATADQPAATLWNASSAKIIYLREVSGFTSSAVAWAMELIRTSTRGTPGSTVTPDIDNDRDRLKTPVSACVLDLGFYTSTMPVVEGPALARCHLGAVIGSAFGFTFNPPIAIPAGTGVACANAPATAGPTVDFTFVWEE